MGRRNGNRSGEIWGTGKYYLVIDNTDLGPTQPPINFDDDIADVNIKITRQAIN